MSTTLTTPEASALLKPDPPIGSEQLIEEKSIEQGSKDNDENEIDKSGDLLNYEHEDEVDDDELEALRMAALQSRKLKKPEQPAYIFKPHPSRNNLTQIVLSGPSSSSLPITPSNPASVALPDTSLPPPGYTPLSIPQAGVNGPPAYGLVAMQPALTIPPPLHPVHIPPPLHLPPVVHHEQSYRPTDYYDRFDHNRDKDARYLTYHSYRDRSPDSRETRERRRSPYERDTYYRDKYHLRGSSPGYTYRGSPGKDRGQLPLKRISTDNRRSTEAVDKGSKFSRYLSGSDNESDESEEEVEEEVEVTASESEEEKQTDATKKINADVENLESESNDTGENKKKSEELERKVKQVAEADDVLNFDCTEEVDEFTNFLNEFEDELKDKTLSDKDKSKVSTCRSVQGENKENKNGETAVEKKKKTKIVKRIVKRPKRKNITLPDGKPRSPKRKHSRSPNRDKGYSPRKYTSYSPDADFKGRRQRTPTLSPEPSDKRLRFDSRHNDRGQDRNRSPYKKLDAKDMDSCNGSKSKSLPPSRVLEDKRRSNSRGAVSQSRDQDNIEKKSKEIVKETPEEREEREFADKLKRAETQEDRDRLIARRQKFTNKVQPIEITKKVISLKRKGDYVNYDEPLNEKRLRNKNKATSDQIETKDSSITSDSGDATTLRIEGTLDMLDKNNHETSNPVVKTKGNVTDLRVQLYKKRLQGKQRESSTSDRDARDKLSKGTSRFNKSSVNSERKANDRFIGIENEHIDEDDSLDPLEKATVDDISPRLTRQNSDEFEESLITENKSRLVLRDANIGLRGRKVEAYVSRDSNAPVNKLCKDYSDDELLDTNSPKFKRRKDGGRVSVLDRLGEPVHKQKVTVHETEDYEADYVQSDDSCGYNKGEKDSVGKIIHPSGQYKYSTDVDLKKSKREKRDKKDKKEKKKLKELKKLEKKLKKLKAKKHQKKVEKFDSEPSETDDEDYDDRIEYFMSEGDQEEQESSAILNEKADKKLKRTKSSPKINKRHTSGGSNHSKKEETNVDDSDDELFAFFEKDDAQLTGKVNSNTNKRTESKAKVHTSSSSHLSSIPLDNNSKRKKDSSKAKGGSSNEELNLLGKMKKKNEKTIRRMKEIEEDKLVHR